MLTLGYQVADWITAHLPLPDDPMRPFELVESQVRFLLAYYSIDERGQFVYRRAALEGAKGIGKTPLAAVLALAEFCGPVSFDGFDADGRPVGRPQGTGGTAPPYVQVAASSIAQADSNVYSLAWALLEANGGRAADALHIDRGRTRLFLTSNPGAKFEAVTSEAGSREGQRLTHAILDETHLWTRSNGGQKLAKTLRRNVGKMGGRSLETCNAPELGTGSVAEETEIAFTEGEPGILFVARRPRTEPRPDATDKELLEAIADVYQDATWVDHARILAEIRDPATGWNEAVRYFLNTASAGTNALVDPLAWAALRREQNLQPGDRIALGFDGAESRNATALIGCRLEDKMLFAVQVWERPEGLEDWRVPRAEVHRRVAETFDRYDVALMYASPAEWRTELEGWAEKYGDEVVLEFRTSATARMGPAVERLMVAVREGQLSHDGSEVLTRHVADARVRTATNGQPVLEKAGPGRLVDAARAAALALEAAAAAPEKRALGVGFAWTDSHGNSLGSIWVSE
jgi:hypothetical protein